MSINQLCNETAKISVRGKKLISNISNDNNDNNNY